MFSYHKQWYWRAQWELQASVLFKTNLRHWNKDIYFCVLDGVEKLSTVGGAPVLRRTAIVDVRTVMDLRLMKSWYYCLSYLSGYLK